MDLQFITDVLLFSTKKPIYVCSLPNLKGTNEKEKRLLSRDVEKIGKFLTKWDQPERGLFFCVSTLEVGAWRKKDNVAEMPILHVDIDLKDVTLTKEEVIDRLKALPWPPTRIHGSGNGLHGYWVLDKASTDVPRVESALKKLAGILAGDNMVTHAVALMRFPGSHNTKGGAWVEVTVESDTGVRYKLATLEKWLADSLPVILKSKAIEEDNPFIRVGKEQSYQAPMDAEEALAGMEYGGDENGVHSIQLRATASLMSRGMAIDKIVDMVIQATKDCVARSAKAKGQRWDWASEERAVRKMCTDWAKKHPYVEKDEDDEDESEEDDQATGTDNVVSLSAARAAKDATPKKLKKDNAHIVLGMGVIESLKERGEAILYTEGYMWHYRGGMWSIMSGSEEKSFIIKEVEKGCRQLKLISTQKIVNETRAWIERNPDIYHDKINWDGSRGIPTRSGMVDSATLDIRPIVPEDYSTYRIECDYDPTAQCPWWVQSLVDCFPDPSSRDTLQEILGAALLREKPRSMMRALVLMGDSWSGKSHLLNVLGGLLTSKPNVTPFSTLEGTHGRMDFLRPVPWVLHEAFEQSSWELSGNVKALLSGDPISVNMKNGPMMMHTWKAPAFWGSNSPAQFKEASRAMENRILPIKCTQIFDKDRPVGAAKEAYARGYSSPSELVLVEEKSGLLNWALLGLQRLRQRGHFLLSSTVENDLHTMRLESNIVAGFLEECVVFNPEIRITIPDFMAAYAGWWEENRGGVKHPNAMAVGKALGALSNPRIGVGSRELRDHTHKYFVGMELNVTGLDFFESFSLSRQSEMSSNANRLTQTHSGTLVNKPIPPEWDGKEMVVQVRGVVPRAEATLPARKPNGKKDRKSPKK